MPSILHVMSTEADIETPQQKRARQRRRGADRARGYRQRKRSAGCPLPRQIDGAISEAIAFLLVRDNINPLTGQLPIDAIVRTARTILVKRQGFDRTQTTRALVARIAPRDEHQMPDSVPTLRPRDSKCAVTPQSR